MTSVDTAAKAAEQPELTSRDRFELAYAVAWHKSRTVGAETPEMLAKEIKCWRAGDTYPDDLPRLRFGWEGYQWALAATLASPG